MAWTEAVPLSIRGGWNGKIQLWWWRMDKHCKRKKDMGNFEENESGDSENSSGGTVYAATQRPGSTSQPTSWNARETTVCGELVITLDVSKWLSPTMPQSETCLPYEECCLTWIFSFDFSTILRNFRHLRRWMIYAMRNRYIMKKIFQKDKEISKNISKCLYAIP